MDRNMRFVNSGPRSLPHMSSSKRHSAGPRLSPPAQSVPGNVSPHNNGTHNHHEDLIQYIYESWSKVTRDLERGGDEAKYYQEVAAPRQLANFRPFNLEELWGRRMLQNINRNKHRS